MRLQMFFGFLLIFLAFWKGDGGYLDLREYLDDAERLWTKGDLRLPSEPGEPPRYNRYSLGLPFLSGPFILAGSALERLTSGALGRRQIGALSVPVLAALAGVLLFEIAVLLGFSRRLAFLAALVYGLGSPHLTYARLFYADMGVECGVLLAVWSALRLSREPSRGRWALVAGAGLAAAGACHYPHALLVSCVGACLMADFLTSSNEIPKRLRLRNGILLCVVPALAAGVLVGVNLSRYHQLVPPRYQQEVQAFIAPAYIVGNLRFVGNLMLRTPWFFPAVLYALFRLVRPADATTRTQSNRWLNAAVVSGVSVQLLFWLSYFQTNMFPIRYLQPMSALAALGLPGLLRWIDEQLPTRGVAYTVLILLLANAMQFFGDTIFQPIFSAPPGKGSGVWFYTWYMQPFPAVHSFDGGTPGGALQFAVLIALLAGGAWMLRSAFVIARKESSG